MTETNLFELFPDLDFDPPSEKSVVQKLIEDKKGEIKKKLNVPDLYSDAQRKKLDADLSYLQGITKGITITDEFIKNEADKRKEKATVWH
jgi:hypothetical protein